MPVFYQHALTTPEKVVKFDPYKASVQEFYVTTYQPVYFVSESFEEAKQKMRYLSFSLLHLTFLTLIDINLLASICVSWLDGGAVGAPGQCVCNTLQRYRCNVIAQDMNDICSCSVDLVSSSKFE